MSVGLATADDIPALTRVINRAYVVEAHLFRGDRSYFGMLSVDPDWQGRGLAHQIISAAEARAIARPGPATRRHPEPSGNGCNGNC